MSPPLLPVLLVLAPQDVGPLEPVPLTAPAGAPSRLPSLARSTGDETYLLWIEEPEGTHAALRLAVLAGDAWSEPRDVLRADDLFLNWADFPSVAVLPNGTLAAHWLRRRGEGTYDYGVEIALSRDGGASWSEPALLHTDRSHGEHGFASLVAIDAETFGAVWLDGRNTVDRPENAREMRLAFRTFDGNGTLGPEIVLDERVCECCQTGLAASPSGRLLAVYRDRSADEVRDVAWVERRGGVWSAPRTVHDDGWVMPGCPVNGPRVTFVGETAAVAWFTGVGEGGGSVRAAFLAGGAERFGAPIDVDDGVPVGRVDVAPRDAESVWVSWLEFVGEGRAEWRVRAVFVDGRAGEAITIAEATPDRGCGFLRMAADADSLVVAWTRPDDPACIGVARLRVD